MIKFNELRKTRLTNGQHYTFIKNFVQELKTIEGAPEKLKNTINAMEAAQKTEDKYIKKMQGSELTEEINKADLKRDNAYRKLRDMVKLWSGTDVEPQAKAAKALARIIKTYAINTEAQMDEESGVIDNFLTDISTPEMKENVTAIGAETFVENMRKGNEEVEKLLKERDKEDSTKVTGALKQARVIADKAYAAVTEAIESFNYVEGGYADFIITWNGTIDRYKEMLNRKMGITKGNQPGMPGGDETPDVPTPDEPGTGGDGAGGDNPDEPGGGGEPSEPGGGDDGDIAE